MPANVAVLRRTSSAVQIAGWLASGGQIDPKALGVLGTINPVDYPPNAEGGLVGSLTALPASEKANVLPTVRASTAKEIEAVNAILASPQLRATHTNALPQGAPQQG